MPNQINKANAILHWKHFKRYFATAAHFAHECSNMEIKDGRDQHRQQFYTQTAITYTAIALESAANCCLDFLGLQKAGFEEYEKLQTLAKFDLFLRESPKRPVLDREHKLVRPIRNLIACRNATVHSKVQTDRVTSGQVEPNIWEPLGLPHNPEYWQPLHAVKCFTVLSDFFNYLFFEVLGVSTKHQHGGRAWVASILGSVIVRDGGEEWPGEVEWAPISDNNIVLDIAAARAWDLDFAFLGSHTTTGPNNDQVFPKRKLGDYSHCRVEDLTIPWKPIWYGLPGGLGIILISRPSKQSVKSKKAAPGEA